MIGDGAWYLFFSVRIMYTHFPPSASSSLLEKFQTHVLHFMLYRGTKSTYDTQVRNLAAQVLPKMHCFP